LATPREREKDDNALNSLRCGGIEGSFKLAGILDV